MTDGEVLMEMTAGDGWMMSQWCIWKWIMSDDGATMDVLVEER